MEIPCNNEIIVTLTEYDLADKNDTHTVKISCEELGVFNVDFLLNSYESDVQNVDEAVISEIPTSKADAVKMGIGIAINKFKQWRNSENNAIYSLRIEVTDKVSGYSPYLY